MPVQSKQLNGFIFLIGQNHKQHAPSGHLKQQPGFHWQARRRHFFAAPFYTCRRLHWPSRDKLPAVLSNPAWPPSPFQRQYFLCFLHILLQLVTAGIACNCSPHQIGETLMLLAKAMPNSRSTMQLQGSQCIRCNVSRTANSIGGPSRQATVLVGSVGCSEKLLQLCLRRRSPCAHKGPIRTCYPGYLA